MEVEYRRFVAAEAKELADFIAGEIWPYHVSTRVGRSTVWRRVAEGYYSSASARTFWIVDAGLAVGMVRLFALNNGVPLFDLRVRQAHRGRGIGTHAVRWLTAYLFSEFPKVNRIEGTTRQDNYAMRRVFRNCGYAKEAHYRRSWPGRNGKFHDTVGYAILRSDWVSGTVTVPNFHDEP